MTNREIYAGIYLAKNKVHDILYLEVCSRIGAPGVKVEVFADHKMTAEGRAKLNRVHSYLRHQLQIMFAEGALRSPDDPR